ncbi:hypothetical protein ACS0TY_024896 [Phlomoides rotata]
MAKNCLSATCMNIAPGMKLGREATVPGVFLKLNYNEDVDEWLNPRAEEVYVSISTIRVEFFIYIFFGILYLQNLMFGTC